jgi:CheY-like chemotaxis protein
MGGSIQVESTPGVGSTFSFIATFERNDASQRDESRKGESQNGARRLAVEALSQYRVLVVEPRASSGRVLLGLLRESGLEAELLASPEEATVRLAAARDAETPFDLVFVACGSSREDLEAVQTLVEAQGASGAAGIVAILASVRQSGALRRCQAIGLAGYLVEPVIYEDVRRLLRKAAGLETDRPESTRSRGYEGTPLDVLLVEDSAINQQVIRALLESRGHRVEIAEDGELAVRAFAARRFDLVLMDVGLPGKTGPEATVEIRSIESGRESERQPGPLAPSKSQRTPIVAITADASPEQRSRCIEAGMDGLVVKPVRSRTLFEAIEAVVTTQGEAKPGQDERTPAARRRDTSVDWPGALEVTGGDHQLLDRIVEAAREEIPALVEAIDQAMAERDTVSLARAAHTLRGSCRYFGAEELSRVTERLEQSARSESLAQAEECVEALAAPVERLLSELQNAQTEYNPERSDSEGGL